MRKNCLKKAAAIMLATACVMGMTGCAGDAKAEDTLMTVNDEKVSYGLANFYLRVQQGTYETYYSSILGSNMWNQSIDGKTTFAESTIDSVVKDLKEMVLLSQHAKDYDISLTDEEKTAIDEAAQAFIDANEDKTLEVMTADKEEVAEYLTYYTIGQKVKEKVKEGADTEVSDEEAAQRKISYTFLSTAGKTNEDGTTTELTDEEKAAVKEKAQELKTQLEAGADMSEAAKAMEYTASTSTYSDDNTGSINDDIIETANSLSEGQIGDIVETENGYYVVKLESEFDEEATQERKEEIVEERQRELYDTTVEEWTKASEIKEEEKIRKALVIDGTVTIKTQENKAE